MTSDEFMEKLTAAGYQCWYENVVMVKIDPYKQSVEKLRRFVKDSGWQRSWGFMSDVPIPQAKKAPKKTAAKTQRESVRAAPAAVEAEGIPGQMNIFDFLGGG